MNANEKYKSGLAFLEKGDAVKALECFNAALEIWPDKPDFLGDRAVAYFHLKKFDLSLLDLNRAQQLDPGNGYRYSSRAWVKDRLNDTEGAIEDYKKAIEIDPDDAISWNNLGMLEEKLGYIEKAKERFQKADKLTGNNSEVTGTGKNIITEPGKTGEGEAEKRVTKASVILGVFTTKKGIREFFNFIRNGFRLKK